MLTKQDNIQDHQARVAFSSCVQNIAFMLMLSKQMVDGLRLVRDNTGRQEFSPYLNPLVRRGLIVIEQGSGRHGSRVRLSRPGQLVVQLLEEAGMLEEIALAEAAE